MTPIATEKYDTFKLTCVERHVLVSASGPSGNVLKVRPPRAFTDDDCDRFLDALADVTHAVLN